MKKWIAATFLLIPMAVGCGSSGTSAVVADGNLSLGGGFVAQQPDPPPNSTALEPGIAHGDAVSIQVTVTDTQRVYGGAFRIDYDPGHAQFLGYSPGTLLEQGGYAATYQVDGSSTPGQVLIGASRTGDVPAAQVTGAAPIIVLNFRVLQPGSTTVAFSNEQLYDGQVPPQTLHGVQWFGGSLQAN